VVRACLIDVYDTILTSPFVQRMESITQPLGIGIGDWLAEWDKVREDRDRGKLTVAASIARTLPAFGIEPDPALVADLSRRDVESARTLTRLCDDTVPFLEQLGTRYGGVEAWLTANGFTAEELGQLRAKLSQE